MIPEAGWTYIPAMLFQSGTILVLAVLSVIAFLKRDKQTLYMFHLLLTLLVSDVFLLIYEILRYRADLILYRYFYDYFARFFTYERLIDAAFVFYWLGLLGGYFVYWIVSFRVFDTAFKIKTVREHKSM